MYNGESEADLSSFVEYKCTDSRLGDASGAANLTDSKEEYEETTVSKREMYLPHDEQSEVGDGSEDIFQRQSRGVSVYSK